MEIWQLILLFVVSFLFRTFTVMVGGGALVTLPLLMFLGLPPSVAIATARLGTLSINFSLIKFHKKKKVDWKLASFLILPTLIGVIMGTYFVIEINQELYKKIISFVIVFVAILLSLKPKLGLVKFKPSKRRKVIAWFLAIVASFMSALFGLIAIWFTFIFLFLGLDFIEAAGTRKVLGTCLAMTSLVWLIAVGLVNWPAAIALFLGGGLGAWIGTDLGIKAGNSWVKRLFIAMVIISAVSLLFK